MVPGPALVTTRSQHLQPVAHVVGEASHGQPAAGSQRQPVEPALERSVAPAHHDHVHVGEPLQDRGGPAGQAAAALGAAGQQEHESVLGQPQRPPEGGLLGGRQWATVELAPHRRPGHRPGATCGLPRPGGPGVTAGRAMPGGDGRRRDDQVSVGVPPGRVHGGQVGDDGHHGRQRRDLIPRPDRGHAGERMERHDRRGRERPGRAGGHPVGGPQQGAPQQPQGRARRWWRNRRRPTARGPAGPPGRTAR